jgi:hypothetical protein
LKRVIIAALEHSEAEGKIKILSGIAMVSHADVIDTNHQFSFILPSSRKKASLDWDQTIGADDLNENFLMLAAFVGGEYLKSPSFDVRIEFSAMMKGRGMKENWLIIASRHFSFSREINWV